MNQSPRTFGNLVALKLPNIDAVTNLNKTKQLKYKKRKNMYGLFIKYFTNVFRFSKTTEKSGNFVFEYTVNVNIHLHKGCVKLTK